MVAGIAIVYCFGWAITLMGYAMEEEDEGVLFGLFFWPATWVRCFYRSAKNWKDN